MICISVLLCVVGSAIFELYTYLLDERDFSVKAFDSEPAGQSHALQDLESGL